MREERARSEYLGTVAGHDVHRMPFALLSAHDRHPWLAVRIGMHSPRTRPARAGTESLSTLSVRFQRQARYASGRYLKIFIKPTMYRSQLCIVVLRRTTPLSTARRIGSCRVLYIVTASARTA